MQEEVENRTVSLVVSTTRLSTRVLMQAIEKHLNKAERKKENIKTEKRQVRVAGKSEEARLRAQRKEAGPHGKQSVRQLMRSGKEIHRLPVNQEHLREFRKVLEKYGVDFAITKGIFEGRPRYLVFFKAKDEKILGDVLNECTARQLGQDTVSRKSSILKTLEKMKGRSLNIPKKVRKIERDIVR